MALFVVATPIGNLQDASPRVRSVLEGAALILAEDTRQLKKLVTALGVDIDARVLSAHGFNEKRRIGVMERELSAGRDVVLTTDAGTPGLSDPGHLLVAAAHRLGAEVRVVPGPSAVAAAVSVSGFPGIPLHVFGFPPRKNRDYRDLLQRAVASRGTLVFHESPRRTLRLVGSLADRLPSRQACLCRELTKLHEEVLRASLADLARELGTRPALRGEVTLVVGPGEPVGRPSSDLSDAGVSRLAGVLARNWGVSRNEAYLGLGRLRRELMGAPDEE